MRMSTCFGDCALWLFFPDIGKFWIYGFFSRYGNRCEFGMTQFTISPKWPMYFFYSIKLSFRVKPLPFQTKYMSIHYSSGNWENVAENVSSPTFKFYSVSYDFYTYLSYIYNIQCLGKRSTFTVSLGQKWMGISPLLATLIGTCTGVCH